MTSPAPSSETPAERRRRIVAEALRDLEPPRRQLPEWAQKLIARAVPLFRWLAKRY